MARINRIKSARKAQGRCVRCHEQIEVGQSYEWVRPSRYSMTYKKHASCPPFLTSELISDATLADLYDARDNATSDVQSWGSDRNVEDVAVPFVSDLGDILSNTADAASLARDEWQERFEKIPKQLQEGPVAQLLQEKIEAADAYESELQSVTLEDFEEDPEETEEEKEQRLSEWIEVQREEAQGAIDSLEL